MASVPLLKDVATSSFHTTNHNRNKVGILEVSTPVIKFAFLAPLASAAIGAIGRTVASQGIKGAISAGAKGAAKLATKEGAKGLAGQAAKKIATDKGKEAAMNMAMESMRSQQQQNQQKQMQQQQEQQRLMDAGQAKANTGGGQVSVA